MLPCTSNKGKLVAVIFIRTSYLKAGGSDRIDKAFTSNGAIQSVAVDVSKTFI